jgi:hypothetical protein
VHFPFATQRGGGVEVQRKSTNIHGWCQARDIKRTIELVTATSTWMASRSFCHRTRSQFRGRLPRLALLLGSKANVLYLELQSTHTSLSSRSLKALPFYMQIQEKSPRPICSRRSRSRTTSRWERAGRMRHPECDLLGYQPRAFLGLTIFPGIRDWALRDVAFCKESTWLALLNLTKGRWHSVLSCFLLAQASISAVM